MFGGILWRRENSRLTLPLYTFIPSTYQTLDYSGYVRKHVSERSQSSGASVCLLCSLTVKSTGTTRYWIHAVDVNWLKHILYGFNGIVYLFDIHRHWPLLVKASSRHAIHYSVLFILNMHADCNVQSTYSFHHTTLHISYYILGICMRYCDSVQRSGM